MIRDLHIIMQQYNTAFVNTNSLYLRFFKRLTFDVVDENSCFISFQSSKNSWKSIAEGNTF